MKNIASNFEYVEAPDALTDRKWAQNFGKRDAEKGECFFPEQVGAWLQMDYAEGFAMARPENESAKAWLAQAYRRLMAEEMEMAWRDMMLGTGATFRGVRLEPVSA